MIFNDRTSSNIKVKSLYTYLTPYEIILIKVLDLNHMLKFKMLPEQFFLSFYEYFCKKLESVDNELIIKNNNGKSIQVEIIRCAFYRTAIELTKNVYMKGIVKKETIEYNEIFSDMIEFIKLIDPTMLKILQPESET